MPPLRSRTWRLAATHTHLYPGARLADLDPGQPPRRGDALVVEFSDQRIATGNVTGATADRFVIVVEPYTTAHGTAIARKTWTLARDAALWKVAGKGVPSR